MAETTNNNTNQVPKYTPEQEAARKDPALASTPSGAGAGAVGQPQTGVSTGQTVTGQAPGAGFGTSTTGVRDVAMEEANRAKMLETGELKAGGNEQLAQEKVNMFTYGVGAPVFGAIDSSATAAEEVGGYAEDISAGLADVAAKKDTPEYKYYSDYEKQIQESRDKGEDLYGRLMENIEEDYRIRELEQRDENRITTGAQSKQLARMGAYGRSGSAMSYMQDVDRTNQRHLNKLLMEKERLLIEATSAFEAQDYGKVQDLITANKDIVDQYNEVEQMMFQDSLATDDQIMQQARFGWDKEDRAYGNMLEDIKANESWDSVSPERKASFMAATGMNAEDAAKYFEYNKKLLTVSDEIAQKSALVDLADKIKNGQTFSIGNTTYYGTKTDDSTISTTQLDDNGNVTGLVYDKNTHKWTTTSLGNIGKTSMQLKADANGDIYAYDAATNTMIGVHTSVTGTDKKFLDPKLQEGYDDWFRNMGGIETQIKHEGHNGIDIANEKPLTERVDIPAKNGGTVIQVGTNASYGNFVVIEDSNKVRHQYSHLNSYDVMKDDIIEANQSIGDMGNTGNVTSKKSASPDGIPTPEERALGYGRHLHYEEYTADGESNIFNVGGDDEIIKERELKESKQNVKNEIDQYLGEDKFYDTAKYIALREDLAVNASDKLLTWFDKTYPAQDKLNPNDPTAKKYFQTGPQQLETPDSGEDALKNYLEVAIKTFSEKEIEKLLEKKYGFVPDSAKQWFKDNK